MNPRKQTSRGVDATIGLVYFALIAAFIGAAVLIYDRAFVSSVDVDLRTDTVGSALQKGSDVKLHGVPVGEVTKIQTASDGAVLTLALKPDAAKELSTDTTARLLPKTLFGERYVSLQRGAGGSELSNGDVIQQDTSHDAAELQKVLDGLLPLLRSIEPDKLQASLNELATMLRGQGTELGDTLQDWGDYLTKLQPHVPQMAEDFDKLARVADTYADAAPDLLNALDSLTTTSRTFVAQRSVLTDVYQRVIASSDTTRGFVEDNENTITVLSRESRKALEAAAPHAKVFPCLLRAFRQYIPQMDKSLGKGTNEPGMHVTLNVSKPERAYRAGVDTPRFTGGQSKCPYVPSGVGRSSASLKGEPEAIAPPAFRAQGAAVESEGLGQQNSRAENQMIAELVAPTQDMAPGDYPDWSSLLLGPALRGTKVTLR